MDEDLVLIFGFITTVVLIVTLGINWLVSRNLRHREVLEHHRAKGKAADASEHYRKLEERVRVLERIATDGNPRLAAQIEELRDLQEIDAIASSEEHAR